jgi:tetratricopeptide (TPR) repeat protein
MTNFCKILSLPALALAIAAGTPVAMAVDSPPTSLSGGSAGRSKIAPSQSKIQVEKRNDDVTKQPKQKLSEREKRESKGQGIMRSELESMMIEKQLVKSLDREIAYSERLLPTIDKRSEQKPEIARRLIESYHQKALLMFFEESRRYDISWEKWNQGGRSGPEPLLDTRASKTWTSKVIQRCQQFITEYPKHKRIDDAYFQIAFALDSIGQRAEAAGYYSQIIKRFPNSKRIPDAHFSMGEYYFDKQDYRKSLASFQEATRYTRAPIYPWAVYKIAWCYFNLQEYRKSLLSFQQTVSLSKESESLNSGSKVRLKDEALREMVNVYSELGETNAAEQYFASQGGEKFYGDLLIRLASQLRERGQFEKSINLLRKFVARNPTNLKAAEIQIQIVDTANKINNKATLWSEMKVLAVNYRANTPWEKKNAESPEVKELIERVHTVALTTTKQIHSDFQKTSNKALAREAEMGYQLYLTYYGDRKEANEVRFLLAELQYQQSLYSEALKHFTILAELKEKTPYFTKSAEYMLSASYFPAEAELSALRKKPAKQSGTPIVIPASIVAYLKTCDTYSKWFPQDKKVKECEIDAAEVYLKHNNFPEAEKRLSAIAKNQPTTKAGLNAATTLLWLSEKDTPKLIAQVDELSKIPQYNQGDLGKRMKQVKETYRFEQTRGLEKNGQNLKAAQEFEKIATENPNSADADKALFNAGVNYRKGGDADKAIGAFTQLYSNYPKSPSAANSIKNIIEISDERLDVKKAAQHSYIFLQRFPKDPAAPVITRETCYLYDALNDITKAAELCKKVVATRKQPDAGDAARTLGDLYYRNRRYNEFLVTLDDSILRLPLKHNEKLEWLMKGYEIERKMGRATAAKKRFTAVESTYRSNPNASLGKAVTEIAHLEFQKEMPVFNAYRSLKIESKKKDGSDLIPSVKKKSDALDKVEKSFQRVVKIGDPEWAIASLYTMAYALDLLSADLRNPTRPSWASEEDMKMIRAKFSEIASAPLEKSKLLYLKAVEVAAKEGIESEYSRKAHAALVRIAPKEFRMLEEWVPETPLLVSTQWLEIPATQKAIEALGGAR